ncbi:MAG: hypothetical protein OEP52_07830, partial [Acidimicrobiia bacterium]|nr:hypothetical protein [Acidimicrobiia bacterium]
MVQKNAEPGSPIPPSAERRPWYRTRGFKWTAVVVGVVLVFHLAGGWYFSGEIYSSALEPDPSSADFHIPVIALGATTVTLSTEDGPDELRVPGVWGLDWPAGYGRLTELITTGDET